MGRLLRTAVANATASTPTDDEELQSLAEETGGSAATNTRNAFLERRRNRLNPGRVKASEPTSTAKVPSTVWYLVGFFAFGLVILFISESIEFKVSMKGGDTKADSITDQITTKNTDLPIPVAVPTNPPATAPTDAPVNLPDAPVALPTEAPVAATPAPVATPEPVAAAPVATAVAAEVPASRIAAAGSRTTYTLRGQPMTDEERAAMTQEWGSWTLVDAKERPTEDIYVAYSNRDIPREKLPPNAWQLDTEYLSEFVTQGLALVERAQNAILAEYGHTEGTFEERSTMFQLKQREGKLGDIAFDKAHAGERGGWTTPRSWEGLKRRLLHAILTEDSFVFAMGGHSSAAGHGNHFQQSYTLQVQWILESLFARLGVKHQARNFGNGGLGTAHNGFGAGSIYGPDVDLLMWDSGMTEREPEALDMFARQGLMGGIKVPVLWNLDVNLLKVLHDDADVDAGVVGTGFEGIQEMATAEDFQKIPWAAQYVRCVGDLKQLCRENEYIGQCWIDRDDVTPLAKQGTPTGRASWHQGNRKHQVTGRILAFTILSALNDIFTEWKGKDNFAWNDEDWHLTAYYDNIRTKVIAMGDTGFCQKYVEKEIDFACKYPVKARTEFTPRAYPGLTNIRTVMPPAQSALINDPEKNFYEPPDVFNPALHPPRGAIDVLNILENGVPFQPIMKPDYTYFYKVPTSTSSAGIPVGKGISLDTKSSDELCDGSVDSFCDRGSKNACLLQAHNDGRNGLKLDSFSGWLTLTLPDVKYGYITIKIESWHQNGSVRATKGWTSINNEARRSLAAPIYSSTSNSTGISSRFLKAPVPEYCDAFHFEYAIDGKITSLTLDEFSERRKQVQRVVETVRLLADPEYTQGIEKEVEVAIRMTGCERVKVFQLTHVYWA